MSETITVHFRDGTEKAFNHVGRPGGSYTIRAEFKDGWLIVEDEYRARIAFPADLIADVAVKERDGW